VVGGGRAEIRGSNQTTNLGVRSSNLFGRATSAYGIDGHSRRLVGRYRHAVLRLAALRKIGSEDHDRPRAASLGSVLGAAKDARCAHYRSGQGPSLITRVKVAATEVGISGSRDFCRSGGRLRRNNGGFWRAQFCT
jgi:hypothetical protein